jgi:phosphate acetyltransferase
MKEGNNMNFIDKIKTRARKNKKTIVLPESMDRRVVEAAATIVKEDIADVILIGKENEIEIISEGLDLSKVTIINPYTSPLTEELTTNLYELRKEKGMTLDEAERLLKEDYMYYACM